ncbi:MAG: hypothetical protein ABI672_13035 [Vicinamibacteria bacterium]
MAERKKEKLKAGEIERSLRRYWRTADRMRQHFIEARRETKGSMEEQYAETRLYMQHWYACLLPVVEGWRRARQTDEEIDRLLRSNTRLLYEFRNGVFHFHPKEFDKRFMELIEDGENVVEWVTQLTAAFGRWLDAHEAANPTPRRQIWEISEAIQPEVRKAIAKELGRG